MRGSRFTSPARSIHSAGGSVVLSGVDYPQPGRAASPVIPTLSRGGSSAHSRVGSIMSTTNGVGTGGVPMHVSGDYVHAGLSPALQSQTWSHVSAMHNADKLADGSISEIVDEIERRSQYLHGEENIMMVYLS